MNAVGHLTEKQLLAFADGLPAQNEADDIGRHLLQCAACRDLLPAPTTRQFFTALMDEREAEKDFRSEKLSFSRLPVFSTLGAFFRQPSALVRSGSVIVVVAGLLFLVWFAIGSQSSGEKEIARVFDVENGTIKQNETIERVIPPGVPAASNADQSGVIGSISRGVSFSKTLRSDSQKRNRDASSQNEFSGNFKKGIPKEKQANISSTRGIDAKRSRETRVEMEVGSNDEETIIFRWTKVPNALKYHLYISDDDEILVDEYETEGETFYVLKKTLDPMKIYRWKIIVTLENGNTTAGDSQKFSVKSVRQNQKKSGGKRKSAIRCVEKY